MPPVYTRGTRTAPGRAGMKTVSLHGPGGVQIPCDKAQEAYHLLVRIMRRTDSMLNVGDVGQIMNIIIKGARDCPEFKFAEEEEDD